MIFCLGDVMVDVLARLPGPLHLGSDTPAPIRAGGGGSAANTAAWVAAAGAAATFVGRVGDDAFGRAAREELSAVGVELAVAVDAERPTGTCLVLVEPGGERTMIPSAGANATLSPEDLPTGLFRTGDHLHVSGYALFGGSRPGALAALAAARDAGMTVSVGAASSAPLRDVGAEVFLAWIGTDLLLFANHEEAAVLSGRAAATEAARHLAGRLGRVIVTCGADGAVWASNGSAPLAVATSRTPVLDSTGAGDAFAAGALVALAAGATPDAALGAGHELAARACRTVGARPVIAMPVSAAGSGSPPSA